MNITSRQLKAFLLTAQHQSFSRAAEQLFITQSGMSVLVRELDADRPRLIEMVQSGEIDVGLTAFQHAAPGVTKIPLVRFSLILIQAESAPRDLGPRVRWVDIAARKFVGSPPDAPVQELIDEHLRRVGRHQPPEIVCNYLETQIAMVESGAGLAVMPTLALPACLKRRITLHALVDPVASGTL